MKTLSCDVAVIGAGSAGLSAYRAAVKGGAKTLLIEAGPGGTTCTRFGCMPSKLLLAAARATRDMRAGASFGVKAAPKIDGPAVMARVQRERDYFVALVMKEFHAIPAKSRLHGHARFAGPTQLTVDDHFQIDARAIVIAVGAKPAVPKSLQDTCGERVLTHETVFELKDLPKSLAVIGAGPLGVELAIAFARLGVRVALFDEGFVVGGMADPVVQDAVQKQIGAEVRLHLGVQVETRKLASGDIRVSWRSEADRGASGVFQYVLSAAGRPPVLDGLDLQMSGLGMDEHGVPAFDLETLQCGKAPIFIAGDADNARPVLHEASAQGDLAGTNAARWPKLERRSPLVKFAITFTDPDMAVVGDGFDPEQSKAWAIGCSADNGRDRVDGRDPGILRIYVRREDKRIIGGELFGPGVEHLAQMLAWLVQLELTVDSALGLPFYHPTIQEDLRACLRDAKAKLG